MNKKGFTLIELLVVIAIIGLLSTLAVVALSSAREKARDSKRLADLKQVQTALELYYTDNNAYPAVALGTTLGVDVSRLSDGHDFDNGAGLTPGTIYMGLVPSDPQSLTTDYEYTSADGSTYSITATLEGTVGSLTGNITASPSGIQ